MLVFEKNEEASPYQGAPRAGFSFTYIRPLHAYALFGGANNDNDLYLFNIAKGTWSCQPTTQKKPSSRKYHAAVFIEYASSLLIHAGEDDQAMSLQDFFALSIKDWKWRKLILVKCPQPRENHCLFLKSERELILFGGKAFFNQPPNDIWRLNVKSKQDSFDLDCQIIQPRGKPLPKGRILNETILFSGQRLYAGSFGEGDLLRVFCFDFRDCEWREIELGLRCTQARMFRAVRTQEDEGFVLALSDGERRKTSPSRFFYFEPSANRFRSLQDEASLFDNCDQAGGDGGESQILCLRQGRRMFTARYAIMRSQQPEGGMEDYLIAIKHEQILSQELLNKNSQLEELHREMQNYITQLIRQYVRFEEEPSVEAVRTRHIEDCKVLKREYGKLDRLYDSATEHVRTLRKELTHIHEDFQRYMETEFDEDA